jgi:hypothetical protein
MDRSDDLLGIKIFKMFEYIFGGGVDAEGEAGFQIGPED